MEIWRENLYDLLGHYALIGNRTWYDNLYRWCGVWAGVVSENDNFSANLSTVLNNKERLVSIRVKLNHTNAPEFVCNLKYEIIETDKVNIVLFIKSVKGFDFLAQNKTVSVANSDDIYLWDEDEIVGYEIFQEGFVLETVSIAFSKYLSFVKSKNSHLNKYSA